MSSQSRWVSEMHVQCSLPKRADAIAMSDCCREIASGAVYDPAQKAYLYRCRTHMGLITLFGGPDKNEWVTGESFAEIPDVKYKGRG
jgi:hypothetical protein